MLFSCRAVRFIGYYLYFTLGSSHILVGVDYLFLGCVKLYCGSRSQSCTERCTYSPPHRFYPLSNSHPPLYTSNLISFWFICPVFCIHDPLPNLDGKWTNTVAKASKDMVMKRTDFSRWRVWVIWTAELLRPEEMLAKGVETHMDGRGGGG